MNQDIQIDNIRHEEQGYKTYNKTHHNKPTKKKKKQKERQQLHVQQLHNFNF